MQKLQFSLSWVDLMSEPSLVRNQLCYSTFGLFFFLVITHVSHAQPRSPCKSSFGAMRQITPTQNILFISDQMRVHKSSIKTITVPRHTPGEGGSTNPLRPAEAAISAQSVFKGDILVEAIQTALNEFLMRDVASGEEKEAGGDPR